LDRQSGVRPAGGKITKHKRDKSTINFAESHIEWNGYGDTGGASRFFQTFEGERMLYCAKSSRREREAGVGIGTVKHPTVKPLALCKYLATLIVPPEEYRDEANLLIPFAGVLSEAIGALLAGWRNITAIELEKDYCEIGHKRIDWWLARMKETGLTDPKAILKMCLRK